MPITIIKKIELQGILIVNDFDSKGNPIRFALLTDDENKYILELGRKNPNLSLGRYNRKKVHISGVIRFGGNKNIVGVNEIKILKKNSPNWSLDII